MTTDHPTASSPQASVRTVEEALGSRSDIVTRLHQAYLELPAPSSAVAAYRPVLRRGEDLWVSGQLPLHDGALVATGRLGAEVDLPAAQHAARHCALNVLGQTVNALAEGEQIAQLVKITVFVASADGFSDQHVVANAASELFTLALAERGEHARSAVGVAGLPMNAPVEVEAHLLLR